MIQLSNFAIRRGGNLLFANASMQLHPGWKVGLTGVNGAGKSSLFAALMGSLAGDAGTLTRPSSWVVAHMAQEVESLDMTALDFVLTGDEEWWDINSQLLADETAEADNHLPMETLTHLHSRFGEIDGYTANSRAAQMLAGLGFSDASQQRDVASFSGGWRMRLNLARTLMSRSDLLLLDEPTNHLDLDAILWLEDWLKSYAGTLILISHDRDFLDAIVDHIIHVENQAATLYTGNYSTFEKTRAERLAQQQQSFEKQQATKAHLQKYIDRFKAQATKARQAQSRIKQLERMVELSPAHVDSCFTFSFLPPTKMSSPLLTIDAATMGYSAEKPIIKNVKLQITPESRIGLLGLNGAGKSTLIKSLVGDLPLLAGESSSSEHLNVGYFAQHQLDALDSKASPMLMMRRLADRKISDAVLRAFLGSFGFSGERMDTPCLNFSGGERSRLALALIVWQKPNVLVLDEPTNHLDLDMRHALTMALQDYEGAVVLVSHERQLISSVCQDLLLVHNGSCTVFDGDLVDYATWLRAARAEIVALEKAEKQQQKQQSQQQSTLQPPENKPQAQIKQEENKSESKLPENAKTTQPATPAKPLFVDKEQARKDAAAKREQSRPLRKKVEDTEKQNVGYQKRLAAIETLLADSSIYDASNKAQLLKLMEEQTQLKVAYANNEEVLLELMMALEEME